MKETRFIAQNKDKWQESEDLLKAETKDPEKLTALFTQVIDDLSFSRTFYPNRSVRVYLNKIGREYFSIIYNRHTDRKNIFVHFWLEELPQVIIHAKWPILISLIIFLLAAGIGVFSAMNDPEFASTILSEEYVAMTKENIDKGDPMAVYKKGHQVDMFLGITLNNLMVAFRTYVFGVFFSLGTIAILLYNGIMVGCFQFFFIERNLFAESALTIWLHGTLEISSIILAGGAGLTLGSGLIFPGTYSRLQAFQISAMRSLKLMLGITPIFVVAAIIESFLTRYTDVPDVLRLFLILLSLSFIIGYFVIYPWLKSKKGFSHPLTEVRLPPSLIERPAIDRIKNNAEILKDAFLFYKRYGNQLLPWIMLATGLAAMADFLVSEPRQSSIEILDEWWISLFQDLFYGIKTPTPWFIMINAGGMGLIVNRVIFYLKRDLQPQVSESASSQFAAFGQTVFVMSWIYALIYAIGNWGGFLSIFFFVLLLQGCFVQYNQGTNIFKGLGESLAFSKEKPGQLIGLQLLLFVIMFSFLLILSAPLLYVNLEVVKWNFSEDDVWSHGIIDFIGKFVKILAFHLVLPIAVASAAYLYFSLKEVVTADYLKDAISRIGSKSKTRRR